MVDAVLEQVIDLIRAGRLPEGALLPGERQLALAMDASRRTIREAIDVLEQAGVVTVAPGRAGGTRIASIWIPHSLSGSPQELPDRRAVPDARSAPRHRTAPRATCGPSWHGRGLSDHG